MPSTGRWSSCWPSGRAIWTPPRGSNRTAASCATTGLGLAIVKHVIQRHGGEILIDSELGKGSVFALTLPAARVRALAEPAEPAPEPSDRAGMPAAELVRIAVDDTATH